MLSLMIVLVVFGIAFAALRKWKEYAATKPLIIALGIIVLLVLGVIWDGMFVAVRKHDTGYYQQRSYTLVETRKERMNWLEISEDRLSDKPELLNYVKEHLNEEITAVDEELNDCIRLQSNDAKSYRWWLYFGISH